MLRNSLLVLLVIMSNMVFGQWSNDPEENLDVFPEYDLLDASGGFTSTGCRDGSVYITAYSRDSTLLVTLLNAEGISFWRNEIIQIENPTPYAFISFSDSQDNLFLCYARHYGSQDGFDWNIVKINKQGEFCWGENGIAIPFPYRRQNVTPYKWTVNENGDVFLFSMQSNTNIATDKYYAVYRIDKNGNLTWGKDGLVLDDMENPWQYVPQNIIATSDGGILVMYQQDIGPYHNMYYEIHVRKYDKEGNRLWEKDPMIYQGYSSYNSVRTISDQNDGLYFTCSSSVIQHVDKNGSYLWEGEGANLGNLIYWSPRPEILGINTSGDLLLKFQNFYKESSRDLRPFIQIVKKSGELALPVGGEAISIPEYQEYDIDYSNKIVSKVLGDSVYYFYSYPIKSHGVLESEIMCYPTTFNQIPLWKKSLTIAKGLETRTSFSSTPFVNNQSIVVWVSTLKYGVVKIKAQNIHSDGTLGNKFSVVNEITDPISLTVYYDPSNRRIVIPEEWTSFSYQMVSMTGNVIINGKNASQISIPNVQSGIYIIRFSDGLEAFAQKIFIQ